MTTGGKVGAPTLYNPDEHPALAQRLCAKGATLADLARKLGVARSTVIAWQKAHPAFGVAVREGREAADDQVEAALFKRAVGYRCRAVKVLAVSDGMQKGSHVEKVPVTEIYPPDVAACSLWLRNRRSSGPDAWREKQEIEIKDDRAEKLARARARALQGRPAVPEPVPAPTPSPP